MVSPSSVRICSDYMRLSWTTILSDGFSYSNRQQMKKKFANSKPYL